MAGEDNEQLVIHAGIGKKKCKSCGVEIVFAFTEGGNKAPFQRDDQGFYILENGTARHVGPRTAQPDLFAKKEPEPQRYTNHFASCPQASQWRGEK